MSGTFDPSDFVEALPNKPNLLFPDEKQQARFELGVSMMVYKWDALDIAVANQWGGLDSAEKRDWITAIIIDLFKDGKIVDVQLIEETLMYAMFDEFETNVEDESALPIAAGIIQIYRQCDAGDYSTVESLYLDWQANANKEPPKKVVVEDSSDEDENVEENEGVYEEDVAMQLDGMQLVDTTEDIDEPIVDEDGFELVQKKGKRR